MRTKYKVGQRLQLKWLTVLGTEEFPVRLQRNGLLCVTVYDPLINETYRVFRWEVTPI